jgi:hypothetical protein
MKQVFRLFLLMLTASVAHAVTVPPPARVESIEIKPAIAAPGVERTILLKGTWPDSCVPGGASVDAPYNDRLRTVIVQMIVLADSAQFCPAVFTPYMLELKYTPRAAGVDNLITVVRSPTLQVISRREDKILVGDPKVVRGADDVTGLWFDPETNGSGLTLLHSFRDSDVVFGTWYVYDNSGIARWYSFQEAKWKTDSILEGVVYETRSPPCPLGVAACPATAGTPPILVGNFRMTFKNLRPIEQQVGNQRFEPTATVEVIQPNGAVVITSRISRLGL